MAYKLTHVSPSFVTGQDDQIELVGGSQNEDIIIAMIKANIKVRAMRVAKAPGVPEAVKIKAVTTIATIDKTPIWISIPGDGIAFINGERPEMDYYKVEIV